MIGVSFTIRGGSSALKMPTATGADVCDFFRPPFACRYASRSFGWFLISLFDVDVLVTVLIGDADRGGAGLASGGAGLDSVPCGSEVNEPDRDGALMLGGG